MRRGWSTKEEIERETCSSTPPSPVHSDSNLSSWVVLDGHLAWQKEKSQGAAVHFVCMTKASNWQLTNSSAFQRNSAKNTQKPDKHQQTHTWPHFWLLTIYFVGIDHLALVDEEVHRQGRGPLRFLLISPSRHKWPHYKPHIYKYSTTFIQHTEYKIHFNVLSFPEVTYITTNWVYYWRWLKLSKT